MKHYIKLRIWDFFLCILCQIGLIFNIFAGFILDDAVCNSVILVILLFAVLDAVFLIFAYNKKLMIAGIILGIAVMTVYVFIAASSGIYDDEAANSLGISLFLIFVVGLLVFLLSRSRAGIVVLFVLGNFVIAGSYFLQYDVKLWTFLLFEVAVLLFFLYRNYCITLMNVHAGKVKIPAYLIQSLIICLIAFVLGCGVYKLIIKPLNPPARDLKLITVLEDMEVLKVIGVSSIREMLDPDKLSEEELKRIVYSDQLDEENEEQEIEKPTEEETTGSDPADEQNSEQNGSGELESQFVYNLFHKYGWVVILVIIALIISAAFVIRNMRRKKWQTAVDALSRENQVVNYYQYFLSSLSKLGYKKPDQFTLYEYSEAISYEMEAFQSGEVTFDKLTKVYVGTYYGAHEVTVEEAGWFKEFYKGFLGNTRKEAGFLRYCIKFFTL